MNSELPVFDLRNLKRSFYYFLICNLAIVIVGILLRGALTTLVNYGALARITTWIIFLVLLIPTYLYSNWSKKEIKKILAVEDVYKQIEQYEVFFKRRLLWNTVSLAVSAAFLLVTNKNAFLYVLVIQLVLSLLFYPGKRIISRELNNNDIILT